MLDNFVLFRELVRKFAKMHDKFILLQTFFF